MKKLVLFVSSLSFTFSAVHADQILPELMELHNKIYNYETQKTYNRLLSWGTMGLSLPAIYIANKKGTAVAFSIIAWTLIAGISETINLIKRKQCQDLFKKLAYTYINNQGEIIHHIHANLMLNTRYLLNNNLFILLGTKSGCSIEELIDLAESTGRIEVANNLRQRYYYL